MFMTITRQLKRLAAGLSLSLPLALVAGGGFAPAAAIPANQQRPPATLEGRYDVRPACSQLTAIPGSTAGWSGWGPTVGGMQHEVWYGLPSGKTLQQAHRALSELGFCVLGGIAVNLAAPEFSAEDTPPETLSHAQQAAAEAHATAEANRNGRQTEGGGGFVALALLVVGGVLAYERFEDKPIVRRVMGEPPASTPAMQPVIPNQLPESWDDAPDTPRTARDVLANGAFISRAFYGGQGAGKTNLAADVLRDKASEGVKVFVINLASYGSEDAQYWEGFTGLFEDLSTIKDTSEVESVVERAMSVIDQFWETQNAILLMDEWAILTGKYGRYTEQLDPLVRSLADKISSLSSSGMKRRQAIWTIAPEIVAGTMEDFGKAVKKLQPVIVAVAPGHTVESRGQNIAFDASVFGQVKLNYEMISDPPTSSEQSRICFVNGEWFPLGTRQLAGVAAAGGYVQDRRLPKSDPISGELRLFLLWLDSKVGAVITLKDFKNANVFRDKVNRSREVFLRLCDKSVIKGRLVPKEDEAFFVLAE